MTANATYGRRAWRGKLIIAAILGMLACGDDSTPGPRPLVADDFEQACGSTPCGWALAAGDASQAGYGTSFHPGDHALVLRGSGVTVIRTGDEPARQMSLTFGALQAELAARCDADDVLSFELVVTGTSEGGAPVADVLRGTASPPRRYEAPVFVTLSGTGVLNGSSAARPGVAATVRAVSLRITKAGAGTCDVGSVRIQDTGVRGDPGNAC